MRDLPTYTASSGQLRQGARLIDTLPAGDWRLASFGDSVIATCPDHSPRIYRPQADGSMVVDVLGSSNGMVSVTSGVVEASNSPPPAEPD